MSHKHVFTGLIGQHFPWANGRHTALTLAVSHSWEVERDVRVAERLLRRNRYRRCVIVDKNGENSYDYIIRDRVHDRDDTENPNLERNLRVFDAYPDLCNINARWTVPKGHNKLPDDIEEHQDDRVVKLSALGLAVLHGMGEIVSNLLRQNAMQHWEFQDCSSSEIDRNECYEELPFEDEKIKQVWKHSSLVDRKTGLSFPSLIAQAEPGSLVHLLDFAKGLVSNDPNLISVPDRKGRLPSHYCAVKGHTQLLRTMIRACSSTERVSKILNKLDHEGFTALSLAVLHGQTEIIKILLEHGALVVPLHEQANLNSFAFELCLLQNIFLDREITSKVSKSDHAGLKNLQLAHSRSEQIQSIINDSGGNSLIEGEETVSTARNRFVWGLLVERMLLYIFMLGFLTVVAFCHSGQLGPHRNGFTLLRAFVQDNIIHESFPEGGVPDKYFADIGDDGDFWEWVSAIVVSVEAFKVKIRANFGHFSAILLFTFC